LLWEPKNSAQGGAIRMNLFGEIFPDPDNEKPAVYMYRKTATSHRLASEDDIRNHPKNSYKF
jgi:hypothetical protein